MVLNQKTKNESGRSMVEILGMLAIAGVLSVVSVGGYLKAQQMIKENETVHQIQHLAMALKTAVDMADGHLPLAQHEYDDVDEDGQPIKVISYGGTLSLMDFTENDPAFHFESYRNQFGEETLNGVLVTPTGTRFRAELLPDAGLSFDITNFPSRAVCRKVLDALMYDRILSEAEFQEATKDLIDKECAAYPDTFLW